MRRVGLVRARVAALGAPLAALALTACGSSGGAPSNSAVTVSGKTLSIYAAQPPGNAGQAAADVFDAERLAFRQSGGHSGSFTLRLHAVNAPTVSQQARDAISDTTAIAYLGEIDPGTSGVSVQITNELGLLQVSPTDTAVYLTQATPTVPGSPLHFYPSHSSFQRTFARVVPTTAAEAKVLVKRMGAEHVSRLDVADDGSDYGRSVAAEVRQDAQAAGITVSSSASGANGMFYGGMPGSAATHALDAAAGAAPSARLFASSALYDDTFVGGLSAAAQKALTVSAPGFMPGSQSAKARQFVSAFRATYGHEPAPQAIFGYEAMQALLAVLDEAGAHAASRSTVVDDFRGLRNRSSVLGTYSINGGDTSIAPFVLASAQGGRLVPRAAG